jgi:putative ABC transport system permease protein
MHASIFMETLWQDLKFGSRTLRRNAGFAAVAIATLALGIGANAAIFSVVDAVLLRPLPWHEPDRAVMIWSRWIAFDKTWVAEGEVIDYRKRSRTLQDVAAWSDGQVNLSGDAAPERVAAGQVTANTFRTLGVGPLIGRTFTEQEDVPNGPSLVVLGFGLWNRRYSADAGVIGRVIDIDGRTFEVIGVMPPDFALPTDFRNPEPTELWIPLQMDPASIDHGSHGLYAAGRLSDGATVQGAAAELHGIARAMTAEGLYPVQMQFDTVVLSLRDEVVGDVRRAIWLLLGAVGFLLLIACANVANLLLARAEARQREIAVRSALGAGRARMVRQLLTESLLLTGASAIAAVGLGFASVRFLGWWNPANIPRVAAAGIDLRVLLFTAAVALATSLLFALVPALKTARVELADALKDGSPAAAGGRQRAGDVLVVAELAMAVVLLIGAGLMLRTLWSLQQVPLGFEPSHVLTMRLALPAATYQRPEQVVDFFAGLVDRVRQLPGVEAAGAARSLPLGSTIGDFGLVVEGYTPPPGTNAKGDWQIVTHGYPAAIKERVVRGRAFTAADTADAMLVALINEEMARIYWPGRDPIGGRFKIGMNPSRPWVTVVGVLANVKHNGLTGVVKEKFYIPHPQWHKSTGNPIRAMTLVVKSAVDPSSLVATIRREIRSVDPNVPVADVRTMNDVVRAAMSTPRFTGILLVGFAALALTLAAIGVYGVLSYAVSRRTREIGIRIAIGASRGDVVRMILTRGVTLALAGIAAGLIAAQWAVSLMRGLLYGVTAADPLTFAAVGAMLLAVAIVATAVPAWNATRVNPNVTLKTQ